MSARGGRLEESALAAIDAWRELWRAHSEATSSAAVRDAVATAAAYLLGGESADRCGVTELLESLDAVLDGRAATARDMISMAVQRGTPQAKRLDLALRETVRARGAPLSARSLGRVLGSNVGARLANGKRLVASSYRNHSRLWRIAPK